MRGANTTEIAAAKRTPLGILSDQNPRERILVCGRR